MKPSMASATSVARSNACASRKHRTASTASPRMRDTRRYSPARWQQARNVASPMRVFKCWAVQRCTHTLPLSRGVRSELSISGRTVRCTGLSLRWRWFRRPGQGTGQPLDGHGERKHRCLEERFYGFRGARKMSRSWSSRISSAPNHNALRMDCSRSPPRFSGAKPRRAGLAHAAVW